jgi:hypothetical protein
MASGMGVIGHAKCGVRTVMAKDGGEMKCGSDGPRGIPKKIPLKDLSPCSGHHCGRGMCPVHRFLIWVGDPGSGQMDGLNKVCELVLSRRV